MPTPTLIRRAAAPLPSTVPPRRLCGLPASLRPWRPGLPVAGVPGVDERADDIVLPTVTHRARRTLKHRRAMHYNRLIAGFLFANLVVLAYGVGPGGWWAGGTTRLGLVSAIAQANLVIAMLPRQHWMVNLVGRLATRPATTPPLRLRWLLGKYYHLGGLHVGAAIAGSVWYLAFVASLGLERWRGTTPIATANLLVSALVVTIFVVMIVMAMPARRSRDHDRFELTHRLGAWAALVLVWANTVIFVDSQASGGSLPVAMLSSPTVWLLSLTTLGALWPWLLLRRVPVTVESPSSHVAVVRLHERWVPPIGTTRPISRRPLIGWHHFANVPAAPGESGYRMVVSRAGDWTGEFIDDPPDHVWVRGLPAVGVANVKRLFTRVVYVVTGSGIGPALGHLLTDTRGSRLVWVTRDPRRTYGDRLVDEVEAAQPDAIVWNSDLDGKPDVLRLAYRAYVESGAEAVICISNKSVTWRVVQGLEQRGIPAFGPIWDS